MRAMRLTARQLNRATLGRQLLLRREPLSVVDGVRRVVAIQAQEAASLYLALWNRVASFDPADLDAAFAERSIVKATLIRITLHAVHADDYRAFHAAMVASLRGSRLSDARFTASGMTIAEVDALLPELLAFLGEARTPVEIEAFLERRLGERRERLWWAFRTFAPLLHVPTGGPWSFGTRASFVAAPPTLATDRSDESVQHVVRRFLEGFGPASVPDIAQATILRRPLIRAALEALGDRVVTLEGPDESVLFDVPDGLLPPDEAAAPPRLMAMWDSILLAYADRSRVIPPEYRRRVIHQNGDVLPTLLVDGFVAGVWRPVEGGIEATAFHRLSREAWRGLQEEAAALVAFLAGRDPLVYRRYGHWWTTLSGAEVKVLPG